MWYNQVVQDLGKIPDFIDYYYGELEEAKRDVKIAGLVERALSGLPGVTEHRSEEHTSELQSH